jgi:hypothetical protein
LNRNHLATLLKGVSISVCQIVFWVIQLLLLLPRLPPLIIEEWKLDKPPLYWKPMKWNIFAAFNGREQAKNAETFRREIWTIFFVICFTSSSSSSSFLESGLPRWRNGQACRLGPCPSIQDESVRDSSVALATKV